MISDYREAFQAFLTGLGMPAYLNYQLPQTPPVLDEFPYITYALKVPEGCENVTQTFVAWFHNGLGEDATQDRADFEDVLQGAIPPEGLTLQYGENGIASIFRGGAGWLWDFQDYVDKNIIGVKVSITVRIYE